MRKFLIPLLALLFPIFALACGGGKTSDGKPPEFLGQIYDVIDIKDLSGKKSGFLRWTGSLDDLNQVIVRGEKIGTEPGQTAKEPVFGTLAEAMNNKEPSTTYYVQVKLDRGLGYGQAVAAYNRYGQSLQGSAVFRCMGSPTIFEDKVAKTL